MKAVVLTKYGSPEGLVLKEVVKPTPKDHEVLIKIHAATVITGDCEIRTLQFPLFLALPMRLYLGPVKPRNIILGQELAGEVEAVGREVTRFKVGDPVFAAAGMGFGAYAEYRCLPEDGMLTTKPANMTYEEAATVPTGGFEALHFIRQTKPQHGEKVLINGAGGSIGTYAMQLAKHAGAEVTAVDTASKLEMLRSIGADHVIDYTQEDFTKRGESYDVIFDVVGKSPFARSVSILRPNGRYLIGNLSPSKLVRGQWVSSRSDKQVMVGSANQTVEDLIHLRELIETGVMKSVIDRRYPLEQMAEAHRYVDSGQKAGHVVITV